MTWTGHPPPIGSARRRSVPPSGTDLVRAQPGSRGMPMVAGPAIPGIDLIHWVANHNDMVNAWLCRHGAVLFRGFGIAGAEQLERLALSLPGTALGYTYGSTPRSRERGKVYTSTEYPADQAIPLHNELAYASRWPMRIWFLSEKTARHGGATPIADSRRVFARLRAEVRERFIADGVMYTRNYGGGIDLTWQQAFETTDPAAVERFCRETGIEFEWRDGHSRLRTRQVCQAAVQHPATGEWAWFNQAHLFHLSGLSAEMRHALLDLLPAEELPRNACYGNGQPIPAEVLDEVRAAYAAEEIVEPWTDGDVMVLDNVLSAHGRQPFEGPRKVLVAMTDQGGDAGQGRPT